jgi:hypothetical protein
MNGERVFQANGLFNVVMPNMFSGSILDIEPDTTYEARFTLIDPDGATGETTKAVTVKTCAEPRPAAGCRRPHHPRLAAELERSQGAGLLRWPDVRLITIIAAAVTP